MATGPTVETLEREVEAAMMAAGAPGLALAAVRGEEVVYARGFGVTSAEADGEPVTPETLFRIGSIAKPLTGTLVVRLADVGLLDLDRPVKAYVPWLRLSDAVTTARLTLRHLLTHTSGLPHRLEPDPPAAVLENGPAPGGRNEDARTAAALDDLVRRKLPGTTLIAPLGTALSYSTTGISLAGYVAQVVCGAPYPAVVRRWLLEPLEMDRTTWDQVSAASAGWRIALGHGPGTDGAVRPVRRHRSEPCYRPAGTDVLSTVRDLAHFAIVHLNSGRFHGRAVLTPAAMESMQALHAETYDAADGGHGLTLVHDHYRGVWRLGHGGASGGFGSFVRLAPKHGVGAVIVYNLRQGFARRAEALLDRVFDWLLDLPEDEEDSPARVGSNDGPPAEWTRHAGTYAGWWTGLAEVRPAGRGLTLDLPQKRAGEGSLALESVRAHVFRALRPERSGESGRDAHLSVGFIPEEEGPTRYIKVDGLLCQRVEQPPAATIDARYLDPLAGVYIGARDRLTVRVRNGVLWVHSAADGEEIPCSPIDGTRFACKWGMIAFTIEDGAAVSLKAGQAPLSEPFTYRRAGLSTGP